MRTLAAALAAVVLVMSLANLAASTHTRVPAPEQVVADAIDLLDDAAPDRLLPAVVPIAFRAAPPAAPLLRVTRAGAVRLVAPPTPGPLALRL